MGWNHLEIATKSNFRLGTKIIPKLKSGSDLKIGVDFSVTINVESVRSIESELRQILEDLGLGGKIKIE
jgi:hypothetical protein